MGATAKALGVEYGGREQDRFTCPSCGRDGVLSVHFGKAVYRCFRPTCDLYHGGKLVDGDDIDQWRATRRKRPRIAEENRQAAQEIWDDSLWIWRGDTRPDYARAGLLYLQGRGISNPESEALRQHPGLFCSEIVERGLAKQNGVSPRQPALVAKVTDAQGRFLGIQRIWLGRDEDTDGRLIGVKKAELRSPKKALGPISGGVVRIDPVKETNIALAVAEGAETALAVRELGPILFEEHEVPVWSAVSAGNMPGIAPCVPRHVRHLYICGDNDNAGRLAAHQLAQRLKTDRQDLRVTIRRPRQTGIDYCDLLVTRRTRRQQDRIDDQGKSNSERLRA